MDEELTEAAAAAYAPQSPGYDPFDGNEGGPRSPNYNPFSAIENTAATTSVVGGGDESQEDGRARSQSVSTQLTVDSLKELKFDEVADFTSAVAEATDGQTTHSRQDKEYRGAERIYGREFRSLRYFDVKPRYRVMKIEQTMTERYTDDVERSGSTGNNGYGGAVGNNNSGATENRRRRMKSVIAIAAAASALTTASPPLLPQTPTTIRATVGDLVIDTLATTDISSNNKGQRFGGGDVIAAADFGQRMGNVAATTALEKQREQSYLQIEPTPTERTYAYADLLPIVPCDDGDTTTPAIIPTLCPDCCRVEDACVCSCDCCYPTCECT